MPHYFIVLSGRSLASFLSYYLKSLLLIPLSFGIFCVNHNMYLWFLLFIISSVLMPFGQGIHNIFNIYLIFLMVFSVFSGFIITLIFIICLLPLFIKCLQSIHYLKVFHALRIIIISFTHLAVDMITDIIVCLSPLQWPLNL